MNRRMFLAALSKIAAAFGVTAWLSRSGVASADAKPEIMLASSVNPVIAGQISIHAIKEERLPRGMHGCVFNLKVERVYRGPIPWSEIANIVACINADDILFSTGMVKAGTMILNWVGIRPVYCDGVGRVFIVDFRFGECADIAVLGGQRNTRPFSGVFKNSEPA